MEPKKSGTTAPSGNKKKILKTKTKRGEGNVRTHQIGFLVTPEEYAKIRKNSEVFHNGNISDWIRLRTIKPCLDISVDMEDNPND